VYIYTAQNKNSSDAIVQAENQNAFKYLASQRRGSESSEQRSSFRRSLWRRAPFFFAVLLSADLKCRLLLTDETGAQSSARYTRWRQPVQTLEHNHCQL